MTMETADNAECELTLKLKSAFLLFLRFISIACSSSLIVCGQQLFKFFEFQNTLSKMFE